MPQTTRPRPPAVTDVRDPASDAASDDRLTPALADGDARLDRLRRMARVLDDLVPIPGTRFRFGADALLGLVPGAGDAVTGAVAGYAIIVAARLGAPPVVLARMVLNVLVDALVGTVPLVGDLFDVGFRANRRNVRLAERYAAEPRRVRRSSRAVVFALLALLASVLVGVFVLLGWLLSGVADVLNRIAA